MKFVKLSSAVVLGTLLVGGAITTVEAASDKYPSGDKANQSAKVILDIDGSTVNPTNPEDPDKPIDPVDPENPGTNDNDAMLKIGYVSDLNFGGTSEEPIIYEGEELVLNAAKDTNFKNEEGNLSLNPFINVEDRRVDGDGEDDGKVGIYTITASMDTTGFSNGTTSIKGAEINLGTTTNTYGDTATVSDLTIGAGDSGKEVIKATNAIGSQSVSFQPATLTIPKNASFSKGAYNATIVWNITGLTPDA